MLYEVITPSWTAYDDKMYYSLKQANNSTFDLSDEIMAEMINLNANFAEGFEGVAATYLHTNRSGGNGYASQGSFNGANDVFEITEDDTNVKATRITSYNVCYTKLLRILSK